MMVFRALVVVLVALVLLSVVFLRAVDQTLDQYDGPPAVHSHV